MARNINDLYNFYQYIIRKQRGVYQTPTEFCSNLDAGQLDAVEDYFKFYRENQQIDDAVRPFRVYYQFTTDVSGFVVFPSDYLHIVGTAFTVNGSTVNEITFPNEDEFVSALNSQLRPVSLTDPIGRSTNVGFSIYPQVQQIGFFTYLRRPATPVLSFTQTGRTLTYDPTTSVQLEWSEPYINNILARAFKYAGINMSEQDIFAFGQQYDIDTQNVQG